VRPLDRNLHHPGDVPVRALGGCRSVANPRRVEMP
jgi:hypothetical protein